MFEVKMFITRDHPECSRSFDNMELAKAAGESMLSFPYYSHFTITAVVYDSSDEKELVDV